MSGPIVDIWEPHHHTERCACGASVTGRSSISDSHARGVFLQLVVDRGWQLVELAPDSSALRWVCPTCLVDESAPVAFDLKPSPEKLS